MKSKGDLIGRTIQNSRSIDLIWGGGGEGKPVLYGFSVEGEHRAILCAFKSWAILCAFKSWNSLLPHKVSAAR